MVRETPLENELFVSQEKVREFCGWSGKFGKNLETIMDFDNTWLHLSSRNILILFNP